VFDAFGVLGHFAFIFISDFAIRTLFAFFDTFLTDRVRAGFGDKDIFGMAVFIQANWARIVDIGWIHVVGHGSGVLVNTV